MKRKWTGTLVWTGLIISLLAFIQSPVLGDQQPVYPVTAMPRVDMHTHMDAKTQYAKCVKDMDG
jgi:hypothetical protein